MQDVIRMTYDVALCHPDEITKIWSLSHPDDLDIPSISSGWLIVDALCHPDDLPCVGNSSGWVTAISLCHPDDMLFHFMSSGWLNGGWFLIRMSYGNVIMSSGWDTLPFVSHPDEIANFDFPQHAVALQRFRRYPPWWMLGGIPPNSTAWCLIMVHSGQKTDQWSHDQQCFKIISGPI